jgi:hypothetical protein
MYVWLLGRGCGGRLLAVEVRGWGKGLGEGRVAFWLGGVLRGGAFSGVGWTQAWADVGGTFWLSR